MASTDGQVWTAARTQILVESIESKKRRNAFGGDQRMRRVDRDALQLSMSAARYQPCTRGARQRYTAYIERIYEHGEIESGGGNCALT